MDMKHTVKIKEERAPSFQFNNCNNINVIINDNASINIARQLDKSAVVEFIICIARVSVSPLFIEILARVIQLLFILCFN